MPERRRFPGVAEVLLFTCSTLIGAGILEAGLRLVTPFPIHSADANRDPHEALGYVVSPALADIDSHGFRNPGNRATGETIDLFALGDSHTFGQNVASELSWPQQLGRMANLSVYNYGVGGYGILQYAYLFGEVTRDGHRWVGHNGGGPGISADFRFYPQLGYTAAVLSNYDGAARGVASFIGDIIERTPTKETTARK